MLQMQIQVTQAQIMQLEAMKQQKLQDARHAQQQTDSATKQAVANTESTIGHNLNTFISSVL